VICLRTICDLVGVWLALAVFLGWRPHFPWLRSHEVLPPPVSGFGWIDVMETHIFSPEFPASSGKMG
jgi:hypothetical protein